MNIHLEKKAIYGKFHFSSLVFSGGNIIIIEENLTDFNNIEIFYDPKDEKYLDKSK